MNFGKCSHMVGEQKMAISTQCEECVKTGGKWVHLRTCQTCGVTLCCDSSPNKHASSHAKHYAHPVINSAEPGDEWMYCFEHDTIALPD